MTIIEKVRAKMQENLADPAKANANAMKALKAIHGGVQSVAWEEYMIQFAETAEQLARLKGTDGTLDHPVLSVKRGYLAANGMCGAGTTRLLDLEVDTIEAAP
ncbi:MAG: hypothetical protein ABI977_03290 [Acidobacteriota bacterium]